MYSILAETTNAGSGDLLETLIPFALMLVLMYFMMIRPQQKEQKKK